MTKELEALSILVEKSIYGNQEDNRGSIFESERIIEQALTPPTSKEVCEALSKEYEHLVSYREDIKSFGFYYKDEWYYIAYSHKKTFGVLGAQTASNLLLIARFYEGVVENE